MISVFWVLPVGVVEFALLAWWVTRFAEGFFQVNLDKEDDVPWWMLSGLMSVVGYFAYGFLSQVSLHVPMTEFYLGAFIGPVLGMLGCLGLGFFGYGVFKFLTSIGTVTRRFGDTVRGAAGRVRAWSNGTSKRSSQAAETESGRTQSFDWGSARRKFDTLQQACQSLRSQLREGAAHDQIGQISAELAKVRAAIEADSRKQSALPVLLADYLAPTEQGLRLYELLLKSQVNSAQAAVKEVEEKTLSLIHAKLVALHDQIYVSDIAQLSTVASALELARPVEVRLEAPAELTQ